MGHNRNNGYSPKLQVSIQPNIGLDGESRKSVMEILNTLLADEAVLTMKTRSARTRAHGPGFLELRTLFDQQFHHLNKLSDEIAERVRILGGFAIGSFEEFLRYTRLEELPGEAPDIIGLLADHEAFIRSLREDARKCTEEYEDEGTFELLVTFIRQHEKMAWMLRSYIEPELSGDEKRVA
jgi:starvation-inducible DNA-binding protein